MKHLIFVAGFVAFFSLPVLAQSSGPVELRNPHRRGGDGPTGGNGGGFPGMMPGSGGFVGGPGFYATSPSLIVTPPSVAMLASGPYLFVMRGGSLFQFDKKSLKLLNSTMLLRPTALPATTTTTGVDPFASPGNDYYEGSPPVHYDAVPTTTIAQPSVAISADGPLLFVMLGASLFQLDKKTLKLLNSTDLPAPATPIPTDVVTHTSPPLHPGPALNNGTTF